MAKKITRRALGAVLASAAALAQAPLTTPPSMPPLPKNPEEELKAARDQGHQTGEQLAKFDLPMSVEPAFQFKA
jgi:hypothetical protein